MKKQNCSVQVLVGISDASPDGSTRWRDWREDLLLVQTGTPGSDTDGSIWKKYWRDCLLQVQTGVPGAGKDGINWCRNNGFLSPQFRSGAETDESIRCWRRWEYLEQEKTRVLVQERWKTGTDAYRSCLVYWEEGLWCALIRCTFTSGNGETQEGLGIWWVGYKGAMGDKGVSLRATWNWGGRFLSQLEGAK
jgi:hypothetical protein